MMAVLRLVWYREKLRFTSYCNFVLAIAGGIGCFYFFSKLIAVMTFLVPAVIVLTFSIMHWYDSNSK